mmetsp:Transcript_118149/g.231972  ORF Transcript_118149/g.231972 Transcript_118149/m.231972 type:complete len:258 (-) Transcript_118149:8-781(-)
MASLESASGTTCGQPPTELFEACSHPPRQRQANSTETNSDAPQPVVQTLTSLPEAWTPLAGLCLRPARRRRGPKPWAMQRRAGRVRTSSALASEQLTASLWRTPLSCASHGVLGRLTKPCSGETNKEPHPGPRGRGAIRRSLCRPCRTRGCRFDLGARHVPFALCGGIVVVVVGIVVVRELAARPGNFVHGTILIEVDLELRRRFFGDNIGRKRQCNDHSQSRRHDAYHLGETSLTASCERGGLGEALWRELGHETT